MRYVPFVALFAVSLWGCDRELASKKLECQSLEDQLKALPQHDLRSQFEDQSAADIFYLLMELKCLEF